MLWNNDILKSAGAQLKGRGEQYDSWVYTLPFSKVEITVLKDERWFAGDFMDYNGGQSYDTLYKFIEAIERPVQENLRLKDESRKAKAYSQWVERLHIIGKQAVEDAQQVGVEYHYEVVEDKGSFHSTVFPALELKLTDPQSTWVELWIAFDNDANVSRGITNSKHFTGLPSLKKILKAYYPALVLK